MDNVVVDLKNRDGDLMPEREKVLSVSTLREAIQARKVLDREFIGGRLERPLPNYCVPVLEHQPVFNYEIC